MNCQGLSDMSKRKDVFNYLRQKKYDIYLIQDVHFSPQELPYIRAMWGYEVFINSFSSQSRGVAILFNNTFEYKLHSKIMDDNGNKLILDVTINEKRMTLGNVYGPNKDDPKFYIDLKNNLLEFDNIYAVLGGDFNIAMCQKLDTYNYLHENNKNAKSEISNLLSELNMIDIWRDLNIGVKRFTWRKKTPVKMARLDYFFISENLYTEVKESNIYTGYRTDHSMLTLTVAFNSFKKGKTFWKFNNSLLKDKEYIKIVNETIELVKDQYNTDIPRSNNFSINDQLFLDVLLMEIRGKTISYATYKKKQISTQEKKLITEIEELEHKGDKDLLDQKKQDLIDIRQQHMNGVRVRSRAQWVDEGEKVTKYFCALENRNFISKSMTKLISNSGSILDDQEQILTEVKSFYQHLYSHREVEDTNLDEVIDKSNITILEEEDKKSIEGKITLEEATFALDHFKNNKSPGSDGFTTEFFKYFWNKIGQMVVNSINCGFELRTLSDTQKQGIITCIPKGSKDKLFLKNWRPISLLNVTYKIASASIANRIKPFLPKIISSDQTGFITGRFIGDNIRTLYDLFQYTEAENIPGLLLLIDFEKAFDSLSWSFIEKVLSFFNFGEDIKIWIKTFYYNIKSCVVVNGHTSSFFDIFRGCRQGDPLSPYIFIICAEILALLLKQNKNIKGIQIDGVEFLIGQYADDTSITLDGTEKSLKHTMLVLKFYAKVSGLGCNIEKTRVIWFGSKKGSSHKLCTEENLNWSQESFTLLGVIFPTDIRQMEQVNYDKKIIEIKQILNNWKKRKLTPYGKIVVIKSLAVSKITHLILSIPNPSQKLIKEVNALFYNFLWNGAIDKIKREISTKRKKEGGLDMLNFEKFVYSLKSTWIKRIIENHEEKKWCHLFYHMNPFMNRLNRFGSQFVLKYIDKIHNQFWLDVLKAYSTLNDHIKPMSWESLLKEPLFLNARFKTGKKCFYNKHCSLNGVYFVNDVVDNNGKFLTFDVFQGMCNNASNFIEYGNILRVIKSFMKDNNIKQDTYNLSSSFQTNTIELILSNVKGCKTIYQAFVENSTEATAYKKWKEYNIIENRKEWEKAVERPYQTTQNTRLLWLQFRIIHRILATDSLLYKMKIVNTDKCTFCKEDPGTLLHILWECRHVVKFWNELINFLGIDLDLNTDYKHVLFGSKEYNKTTNYIILLAKNFIHSSRTNGKIPNIEAFKRLLIFQYNVEKTIAYRKCRFEKFELEWQCYGGVIGNI